MATIVKLNNSDSHAILIGVGYGQFESSRPNAFFGNLIPSERSGKSEMAALSTATGDILWYPSEDLTIVSIDGKPPADHLQEYFNNPH